MIRRILHTGVPQVLVLLLVLSLLFFVGLRDTYGIYLAEVEILEGESPEQVVLLAKGGNMLRVNSFYVDGRRIEDCTVEKMTYDRCRVTLSRSALQGEKDWLELQVGFCKWNLIHLTSSPIWIEWPGQ